MGVKFRRQHPADCYILDFYSPQIKLAIEVDGEFHADTNHAKKDKERTEILNTYGITVIRYSNFTIENNLLSVLQSIQKAVLACRSKSIS